LLALRVLALILLAAAFARPFIDRVPSASAALAPARDIVLLVDRSYSMGHGERWARALDAGRAVIDAMRPNDRAAVVFFDERAQVVTAQTGDAAVLRAALDSARVGPRRTRYGPALRAAQALLDASDRPQREVVLISDFQQRGWDADAASRLDEGVALTTLPVADDEAANTLIAGVTLAREQFENRERVRVTARIAHRATAARTGQITLEVDGNIVQTMPFEVEAGDVVDVTFPSLTLGAGAQRGIVRLAADALPADDVHHLILSAARPIRVLLIDGRGTAAPSSLFLRRALGVGESPAFRIATSTMPTAAELAASDVVLLNGAPWPAGAAGERLSAFVEQGGGVLTVLGATGTLPDAIARVRAPVDRVAGGGGAIGYVEYAHPALELFREPRNGDLGSASHYRYRATEPAPDTRVLARFDDGVPALLEARRGRGRVLVATSTLDTYWSDLPLQPVFVPLLHRLVAYGADWHEQPAALTVGGVLVLEDNTAHTVLAPDGTVVGAEDGDAGAADDEAAADGAAA
ncbi:MAG: vWA domain-containing protein, partial [Longimicrobiales bacterium]